MVKFGEILRQMIQNKYGKKIIAKIIGDPAGDYRAQTDESTPFQILRGAGIKAYPAPSNDVSLRIEAVNAPLTRLVEGKPGMLIDKSCKHLIKGFAGGYQYKRLQVSGERYTEKPDKNDYSHVHDALQYLLLGAGEGKKITGHQQESKVIQAKTKFDVFTREPKKNIRKKWNIFDVRTRL